MKSAYLTPHQLQALLESARLINSTLHLDELLLVIVNEINKNLNADRTTLFLIDRETNEIWSKILLGDESLVIRQQVGKGFAGHVALTGEIINIPDAHQDQRFNPEVDRRSGYRTRSVLSVPVCDKDGRIIGVIQSLNKRDGFFDDNDIHFLNALADFIAIAIENARLYEEALERKRLEDEITLAGEIQRHLLPAEQPAIPGYQIYAYHRPSKQIGGDYYDFVHHPSEISLILADVSGKGIPAALLMANLHALCHSLISGDLPVIELIHKLNRHFYLFTSADKYATLFYGFLNLTHNRLQYVNCGHIPPLLLRKNQHGEEIIQLEEGGIPVGMMEDFPFRQGEIEICKNDVILICSDGITEAMNSRFQMFGLERVLSMLQSNGRLDVNELGERLIKKIFRFSKTAAYQDDITLMILKRID